jgi:tRNA pseudouridine55 synthase
VIHALLVIDKSEGLTSHDVVQAVRRWSKQRRVGHLGTLDPLATGVLPLALGEATKLSQLLTHGDKSYRGRIRIGIETTTYDREGEIVEERGGPFPAREELEKALDRFRGEIDQVPPPFSAVKQGGEAAYRRARRGERVELPPRRVRIDRLELLGYDPPFVALEVDCSTGTYLRSLAHDLGRLLGTGAHLFELCRTRSGPFLLEQAVRLEELDARGHTSLLPMARSTGLLSLEVTARLAQRVGQGIQLGRHEVPGAPASGLFQLEHKGRLVALLLAELGFPTLRTLRVFLEGTGA